MAAMTAESVCLYAILGENVKLLDDNVKQCLETWLKKNEADRLSFRNEIQQQRNLSDKRIASLEKELQNVTRKLEMSDEFNTNLKKQLRENEDILQKSRKDFYDVMTEKEKVKVEYETAKQRMERSVQEKIDLNFMLECKMNEINSLQEELKSTKNKLQENLDNKHELAIRAEELGLREWTLQQTAERMKQEKDILLKQINSCNETIAEKSSEVNCLRREKSMQILNIQSVVEQKSEEVNVLQEEITRLKQVVERKDKHIENISSRIREMQECSVELESHYQTEILAQTRVIDSQKKSIEEEKKRTKQLFETIEEMQGLLQAAKQAHVDLEHVYNNTVIAADQKLKGKEDIIKSLKTEIEESKSEIAELSRKSLQSEIEGYFPAASATSKVFQANMTLSEVYSELVKLRERLESSENENERLKDQMQQIINEAEERGPFVYRKISEHEQATHMVATLQAQLSKINVEKERIEKDKDSLQCVHNHLQRECKRLQQQNKDLSMQVRCLTKSVHEARGYFVQDSDVSSSDDISESSSSRIISMHLVTFKDIEGLQSQNQKLLSVVRELSEKQEEMEAKIESSDTERLKLDLDKALKEIDSLRKERRQQSEVLDCLTNQKDVHRPFSRSGENIADISVKSTSFTEETLTEIKKNVEKLTEEYSDYKRDAHLKIEELNKELNQSRIDNSNIKLERTKYLTETEHLKEKLEVLQTNLDQFKNLNDTNSAKSIKLSEKLKKTEELLSSTRQELLIAKEMVSNLENKIEVLRNENSLLKSTEMNLIQERKAMMQQNQEKTRLMATLQSLQSSFEKMEFDSCQKLKIELENKERANQLLKEKLEKETAALKEYYSSLESNAKNTQQKLNEEMDRNHKLSEELSSTKVRLATIEYELNVLKQERSSDRIESAEKGTSTERSLQSLKLKEKQLIDSQSEIKNLRDRLSNLQKSFEGQKNMTSTLEDKLNEQNKVAEEQKLSFDKLLLDKEREVIQQQDEKIKRITTKARQQIANLNKSKELLVSEKEELVKKLDEKDKKLVTLEQSNEEARLRLKTLQSQYEARMRKQEKDLTEAQENYSLKSKEVELLQTQLQSQNSSTLQVPSSQPPSVVSPPVISASPVRHPVLPQQQQHPTPKPTPTASIRPLPMSLNPRVTVSRPSTSASRAATVVAVQPTTDDSASQHVQVPQATVTPTQTAPTMVMVAPTTAVVESVPSTSGYTVELSVEASEQMQNEDQNENVTSEAITEGNNENERIVTQSPNIVAKRTRYSPSSDTLISKKRRVIESMETVDQDAETSEDNKDIEENEASEETQEQHDSSDDIIVLESDDEAEDADEENEEDDDDDDDDDDGDEAEDEEDEVNVNEERVQYHDEDSGESMSDGQESDEAYGEQEFDVHQQESSQNEDYSEDNANRVQEIEIESSEIEAPVENQENFSQEMPILRNEAESLVSLAAEQQAATSQQSFMQAPPPMQRNFSSAVRGEQRIPAATRQSLYFAHGMQQSGTYDDGDDGIVPSTPTLCVPRRGEAFVESLNSPRVPQSRFVFLQTEASAGLAQLASQGALGVDDTRMDLSQFDDASNSVKVPGSLSVDEIGEQQTSGEGSQICVSASASGAGDNRNQTENSVALEDREDSNEKNKTEDAGDKENDEIVVSSEFEAEAECEVEEVDVASHLEEYSGDETAAEKPPKLIHDSHEASEDVKSEETKCLESASSGDNPNTFNVQQRSQTARRARRGQPAVSAGPRTLQRRPVVWESSPPPQSNTETKSQGEPSASNSASSTTVSVTSSGTTDPIRGRRIRLRGSRFATGRGSAQFRGNRPPRSRGGFY